MGEEIPPLGKIVSGAHCPRAWHAIPLEMEPLIIGQHNLLRLITTCADMGRSIVRAPEGPEHSVVRPCESATQ